MKAAFFDVDGTLTQNRVWNGIFEYFTTHRKRLLTHYYFLFIHYSLYLLFKVGLINQVQFRSPWARHLSWYFKGFTEEEAVKMWDWVVTKRINKIYREDVIEILRKHKANGDPVFLVSGGPVGLLERIAKEIGADYAVGTTHEIKNGRYTGKASSEPCQGKNKELFSMQKIKDEGLDIDLGESFSYADSMSDFNLLEMVGNPIAVYPDEQLSVVAEKNNWKIFPNP
ncbi:MAG: HAD-IB family hydrolase [Chloroflexi bacterium]|jgi:HAD superfamily hydrolase (TIGR01490 family)|nr:HAD-IB family hydrolase [Chloroflexota bacterium]MBT3668700.1 HAD-IB family hydrolase [Chloroflexota bacterium]MBT4004149.1 HAD-IB family hydrolase [Chloroflexota bacterium]MBT4305401.1 HAD-IB family hydrolase [Chloroflexota bacterium]MBT4532547.1 HAD-IB family hydrolase [Chloroflexota bacterium]